MSSEECGRSTTPASYRSLGPQGANAQPVWVLHLAQLGHSANCALQTHLTTEPGQLQDPALGTFAGKSLLSCLDSPPEKEALSPPSKALFPQPSPWGSHLPEGALFPVISRQTFGNCFKGF